MKLKKQNILEQADEIGQELDYLKDLLDSFYRSAKEDETCQDFEVHTDQVDAAYINLDSTFREVWDKIDQLK